MSILDLLHIRRTEHKALLQCVVELLQKDERVVAAWLFGSWGRQTSDELSDTDLWVVVVDEHCDAISAERHAYVARPGHPLLVLGAPGNAPAGGAYLMALYAGQAGVHQVDWYWQRQSHASIPQHAVVLFDRVGIPHDTRLEQLDPPGKAKEQTRQERAERATQLVTYFWVMSNIATKSVLRHQAWTTVGMIEMLGSVLDDVKRLMGVSANPDGQEAWRTSILPPVEPGEQIAMLRELAHEMEQLTPQVEALGGNVQTEAIPYVYDFFDLADTMLQEKE